MGPVLTPEGYIGKIGIFDRPQKKNSITDFPNLKHKPVSTPYPPYADSFPQVQHKYGPFPEIIAFYQNQYNIKKTK